MADGEREHAGARRRPHPRRSLDRARHRRIRLLVEDRRAVVERVVHGLDDGGLRRRLHVDLRGGGLGADRLEHHHVDLRDMQDVLAEAALGGRRLEPVLVLGHGGGNLGQGVLLLRPVLQEVALERRGLGRRPCGRHGQGDSD